MLTTPQKKKRKNVLSMRILISFHFSSLKVQNMRRTTKFTREEKLNMVEQCKEAVRNGKYPSFYRAAVVLAPTFGVKDISLQQWKEGKKLGVSTQNTISPEERREKVRLFHTGQYGTTIGEAWRALGCTSMDQLKKWLRGRNLGTLSTTTGTAPPALPSPIVSEDDDDETRTQQAYSWRCSDAILAEELQRQLPLQWTTSHEHRDALWLCIRLLRRKAYKNGLSL